MTKLTSLMSSLKDLVITYRTPFEELQETPTPLPTSEPATSQIVYTVQEADLPTLSMTVEGRMFVVLIICAGKNTDTASRTVYYRMLKNGSSINTGSVSVSAGYFWTLNACFTNVAVGDVLEVRLWATSDLVNWDYTARQVHVSRVALMSKFPLAILKFAEVAVQPVLTLGNPYPYATQGFYVYHRSGIYSARTSATEINWWLAHGTFKLYQIYYGDYSYVGSGLATTSSTYRPYYARHYVPARIQLRALLKVTP